MEDFREFRNPAKNKTLLALLTPMPEESSRVGALALSERNLT